MAIRVGLNHKTVYRYERPVSLSPHLVRLRPAPHCRTPVLSYSLKVLPEEHFENWQQDPHGNFLARLVFPDKVEELSVEVDLVAEMTVINPFDFFVESNAEQYPFEYEEWLAREIRPFREIEPAGPLLRRYIEAIDRRPRNTVGFLVELNARVQQDIRYLVRMEPGVQTCEETLERQSGSCRDSAWLLVQILRHLGLAARFVSGYLIQLAPDVKPLDGPAGTSFDFTDLHAWAEVYVPGAGWIGLDATSGLLAGEGHLPLAATPDPQSAAPITGMAEPCETDFRFDMRVTRIHEDPRVTKPYSEDAWQRIVAVGHHVDRQLAAGDVRLTMGGEPTFVSIDDMQGAEWNVAAVGPTKRRLAADLLHRLRERFAPGGLLHYGQGKWYPGESLPRWALTCMWRTDGEPLWLDTSLIASEDQYYGHTVTDAERLIRHVAGRLGVEDKWAVAAYEDVWHYIARERKLPVNVDPRDSRLKDPEERARLARIAESGYGNPTGYVLPLRRQWWQGRPKWVSGPWPVRADRMFLLPGDSPLGLRLPLDSLPWAPASPYPDMVEPDPFAPREPLPRRVMMQARYAADTTAAPVRRQRVREQRTVNISHGDIVRTALCVEPRQGRLHIFMPPVEQLDDYVDLIACIEDAAAESRTPIVLEGYLPPTDHRIQQIKVTPDPGVIEVNVHPARDWDEMVYLTESLYEDARQSRLGAEKFDLDGRHTGTGGGNHVVMGGATPADSPFLRRPDLLKSLIGYWNNHPGLSYLFSGTFVGPTSQAPRVDEGRRDALYELEIAFQQIPPPGTNCPPWLIDRVLRNLLVDLTGNTHRAEFCIDKLFSPDSSSGRLGLVELRAFEMPPHARMSLTQQLLLRALVARFWAQPYQEPLVHWNTSLHDRFLLPFFVWRDLLNVIEETRRSGFALEVEWFRPHFEFRFPLIGMQTADGVELELRQAIEPWYVLGEEPGAGGTTRYVDSSVERLQVLVRGLTHPRHVVTCNGRRLPLQSTGREGEFVAAVRYRAWWPPSCLHPTIPVHTPLVFDVVDRWMQRSLGGCQYHVAHPAGRNYETFPVNAYEAESRRAARFFKFGHTGGPMDIRSEEVDAHFPMTLDLRREPAIR